MLGPLLALIFPAILFGIIRSMRDPLEDKLVRVLIAGYAARMFYATVLVDLPIFSYGAGGDAYAYNIFARAIAEMWRLNGIHYVTAREIQQIGNTSLPPNMYAILYYVGGQDGARIGNTGLVAVTACLTCLNLYRLAVELGVPNSRAFWVMSVWLFSPAFFLYTSDVYKDGLVLFFVMTAFASSLRLSRKFSFLHLVIGAMATTALYGCRYYLVFVVITPLLVSFVGFGSKNIARQVIGISAIVTVAVWLLVFTTKVNEVYNEADAAFEVGEGGITATVTGGSGVTFDDGGKPSGALPAKLAYTLFSPFPWTGGSIALQFGKIEALLWYFFVFRAMIAARRLIREDRALLMQFLIFIIPTTFSYALIMSNIGLIVRERMGIVMIGTLLGALSWARPKGETAESDEAAAVEAEAAAGQ